MADGAFPLVLLDPPSLSPHVEGCGGRVKDQHRRSEWANNHKLYFYQNIQ